MTSRAGDRCVHEIFEAQAAMTPSAAAAVFEAERLTYAELNAAANQLARRLRGMGVGPDVLAAICLEPSLRLPAAILGVLKAGGAYVPLDPSYPAERIRFMIDDARPAVVLAERATIDRLPANGPGVLRLDEEWPAVAAGAATPPASGVCPDNLFYVIYTSGSTGRPKGSEVTHRAIPGFIFGVDFATFDSRTVLVHHSTVSWDALTLELWPALLTGGRCVIWPRRIATAADVRQAVEQQGVNTLWLTPAVFNSIADVEPECFAGIATLLTGGEAPSAPHVSRVLRACPGLRIVNGYGPSECTVFSASHVVAAPLAEGTLSVPIGRPTGDRRVYVLDAWMNPVPPRVTGEAYVGGPSVARGYLRQPRLTAERFVPSPRGQGERLYRTGDLVRWSAPGTLEFVGRVDQQVKIGGVRIELGEIEAVLAAHPAVREVAVVAREDAPGDKRLVAYVAGADDAVRRHELRGYLRERVPEHMVPSAFVALDALPLTANGKVDRRALAAPAALPPLTGAIGPRDRVEYELVRIWERCLQLEGVGIRDNFFDLGGSSVSAVRCLGQINKTFEATIPVAELFRHSTIEGLAPVVRAAVARGTSLRHLLTLRPPAERTIEPPLVAIHPGGGFALCYTELARLLDDRGVYAIESPGVALGPAGCGWSVGSVEDVAARYIGFIREFAPPGPCQIGGWSFGAAVAFEIACQLQRAGTGVALLVLFDLPPWAHGVESADDPMAVYADDAELLAEMFCGLPRGAASRVLPDASLDERLAALLRHTNVFGSPGAGHIAWAKQVAALARAHEAAARKYVPGTFSGRTVLFQPSEGPGGPLRQDLQPLRAAAAGGLDVCRVPGTHATMLSGDGAAAIARHLLGRTLTAARQGMEQRPYGFL